MRFKCVDIALKCLKRAGICAKLKRMDVRKQFRIRLLISLIFGLIVTSVALSQVGGARSRDIRYEQRNTRLRLERVNAALAKYRGQNNGYPQTLSALKLDPTTGKDGWERDWIYTLPDGKPLVESLGRDGKRGGIGTDSDLSNVNPRPPLAHVPFWMRVQEEDARMMVVSAFVCGLFASVILLGALEKATFARGELWLLLPALIMALFMAIAGAAFITILHVPNSGH